MVGAGLSKLPCLGFLVLALLTHSSVAMKPSDCTCPMTPSSPTTVTETVTTTDTTTVVSIATVPTTVLVRETSLTTVVHTEICSQIMPTNTITIISSCPAMTTPTVSGAISGVKKMKEATPSCIALGGGLGIVTGTLAIILVGVVIGWVWSCHRKRGKSHLEESDHTPKVASFQNPTYTLHEPRPSIQYSSSGPRDTPPSNTTPTTYDVIGGGEAPGEGNYHVLEDEGAGHDYEEEAALTYEVPVQSGATPTPGEEYSTLHHK